MEFHLKNIYAHFVGTLSETNMTKKNMNIYNIKTLFQKVLSLSLIRKVSLRRSFFVQIVEESLLQRGTWTHTHVKGVKEHLNAKKRDAPSSFTIS